MNEEIMNSARGDKPAREHYDDHGKEANSGITFSATTCGPYASYGSSQAGFSERLVGGH